MERAVLESPKTYRRPCCWEIWDHASGHQDFNRDLATVNEGINVQIQMEYFGE